MKCVKSCLFIIFFQALTAIAYSQRMDILSVYFPLNQSALDSKAIEAIDSMIKLRLLTREQQFKLYGYADFLGNEPHNDTLSTERASAVRAYLLARDFTPGQFRVFRGNGVLRTASDTGKEGNPLNRVVQITILPKPRQAAPDTTYYKKFREWPHDPTGRLDAIIAEDSLEQDHHHTRHRENDSAALIARKNRKVAFLNRGAVYAGNSSYSSIAMEAAMIFALFDQSDSVFYYLNHALDACSMKTAGCDEIYNPDILGFVNFSRYQGTPQWLAFEQRILTHFNTGIHPLNSTLAIRLLRASGADQSIRIWSGMIDSGTVRRIEKENLDFIKNTGYKYGFPGKSLVGAAAADAAFLLVQHADADLHFQQKMLESMKVLAKRKDVEMEYVAYLTDRIMVATEGKQMYGTQFKTPEGDYQDAALYPIVDAMHVDERRQAMGLGKLSDYLKR